MADLLSLARNFLSGGTKLGQQSYKTQLAPLDELYFKHWVQTSKIPFDDSPTSDYDMRGFYQAMRQGKVQMPAQNSPFAGLSHYPDTWKTPYHESFSNESMYANQNAPAWKNNTLVDKLGSVVFDEAKR